MSTWSVPRVLVAGFILVATVAAGARMYAQPPKSAGTLSPQDLFEIEQLVQGYTRGIDIGPEDASWVFARDGVFEYLVGPTKRAVTGQKALQEFYAALRKGNTTRTIRHVVSNQVVKATPEGAVGSVYFTTIEPPATITAVGMYEDTFVKTAEGWRIKHRFYHEDMTPGKGRAQ